MMFYVYENTRNQMGSLLAGEGGSCFEVIELPGFMPIYLAEIPFYGEDGELVSKNPILVNSLQSVIGLKSSYESPLETVHVWMFFPGFMNNSEGWQTQRITSIWKGTWLVKNDKVICNRLEFESGESLLLSGNRPAEDKEVKWLQVL